MAFNLQAQLTLKAPPRQQVRSIVSQVNQQFAGINANVKLGINQTQLRQARQLNSAFSQLRGNIKESTKSASGFGDQMGLAARRFAAFLVGARALTVLAGAFKQSLSDAIAFNRELVRISQVTGESTTNLNRLTKTIGALSNSLGVDSSKLLQTSRILAQTGLSANETRIALEALARASLAPTFGEITRTAEVAVAAMQQFNLESKDLEATLGSINAISKSFAVESNDLGVAIQRTGGAFAATGGQLEELLALFTSVRATTRESAESIATGFRTIFTRLQRVRTLNFLDTLGIDLRNAEGEFIGGFKAVERLSEGLAGLSRRDPRFSQIIEELGGFRQVSKVIPLIEQFGTAQRALSVAQKGQTSLTEDAITAQEAFEVQIAKVREEFQELIRTFSNSSTFKTLVDLSLDLASALTKVAKSLEPILPALALLGTGAILSNLGNIGRVGSSFKNSFLFRNEGGNVPGVGSTDTVPAMLTPGEFVMRKSSVQAIGMSTLSTMNRTGKLAGFNKGGFVGRVQHRQAGGTIQPVASGGFGNIALLVASLGGLVASIDGASEGVQELARGAISTAAQFFLFRTVGQSFAATTQAGQKAAASLARLERANDRVARAREDQLSAEIARKETEERLAGDTSKSAQADIQAAQDREKAAKSLTKQEEDRARKATEVQNKRQTAINRFTAGVAAASAALAAFGNFLAQSGAASIRETAGREGTATLLTGAGLSGGVTGGFTGAFIGGAFSGTALGAKAGPIGAGVGAIGGALFSIVGALNEKAAILDEISVAENIESFNNVIKKFTDGRVSAANQVGKLNRTIQQVQDQVVTLGSEARNSLLVQVKGQATSIEQFLTELANSSDNLKDFQTATARILPFYAEITGLSVDELNESFGKTLELSIKRRKAEEDLLNSQSRAIQRLREVTAISNSVAQVSNAFNSIINPVQQVTDEFERIGNADLFKNLSNLQNTTEFNKLIEQFGGLLGPVSDTLVKETQGVADAFQKLPGILLAVASQPALDPVGNFQKRLNSALSDAPEFIRDIIIDRVKEIGGRDGRESNIISRIRRDLPEVLGEITKDLDRFAGPFAEFDASITKQLNIINETFSLRVKLEQDQVKALNEVLNQRLATEERLAEVTEERLRPGLRQEIDDARFTNLTSNLNLGNNAVAGLTNIITDAKDQIKVLKSSLQDVDPSEFTDLRDQLAVQETRLNKANQALKFLADGANRAAPALRDLEDVQKDRKVLFDLAKSFTFNDAAGRRDIGRNITAALIASQRGADAIPGSLRQGALQFLESLGDTQLGVLGGKSGNQVVAEIVSKNLQKQLGLTQQEADAIAKATPEEEKLIAQIATVSQQAIEASKSAAQLIQQDINNLNDFLRDNFKTFLQDLKEVLKENIVAQKEQQRKIQQAELEAAEDRSGPFQRLQALGIKNDEQLKQARDVVELLEQRSQIGREQQRLGLVPSQQELRKTFIDSLRGDFIPNDLKVGQSGDLPFDLAAAPLSDEELRTVFNRLDQTLKEFNVSAEERSAIRSNTIDRARSFSVSGFNDPGLQAIISSVFEDIGSEASTSEGVLARARERLLADDKKLERELQGLDIAVDRQSIFIENLAELSKIFKDTDVKSIDKFNERLTKLRKNLSDPGGASGSGQGFNTGGLFRGRPGTDNNLIAISDQEFIIRKKSVDRLGVPLLDFLNRNGELPVPAFQNGGPVGGFAPGFSPAARRRRRERELQQERRIQEQQAADAAREADKQRRRDFTQRTTSARLADIRETNKRRLKGQASNPNSLFQQFLKRREEEGERLARGRANTQDRIRQSRSSLLQSRQRARDLPAQQQAAREARRRLELSQDTSFITEPQELPGLDVFSGGGFAGGFSPDSGRLPGPLPAQERELLRRQNNRLPTLQRVTTPTPQPNTTNIVRPSTIANFPDVLPQPFPSQRGVASGSTDGARPASATTTQQTATGLSGIDPSKFDATVTKFASAVEQLQGIKLPEQITMTGTHKVEVVINGAEAFKDTKTAFEDLVLSQITFNLQKFAGDLLDTPKGNGARTFEAQKRPERD